MKYLEGLSSVSISRLIKVLLLFFIVLSFNQRLSAQVYLMDNTDITVCTGQFTDDGVGGTPYTDSDYTMTICPGNPGDAVSVDFVAFALQQSPNPNNSDYLFIYDGDNTGANSLGSYTGSQLVGITVTASVFNPTGCLTFRFVCNTGNTNLFPGWAGVVECTTPCASPTSAAVILDPVPSGPDQVVGVCENQELTFSDNGSLAQPGFNLATYIWNFGDESIDNTSGAIATHSFSEPGEYIVTLTVEDNNGCQSLNIQPLQVLVSTLPEFNSDFDSDICLGTTASIDGTPLESVTWTALPPQVVGGQFYLADGPGFSFENSIVFDFFEDGAVLEDCNDLLNVTLNMEHSYMGDLNISMTCPDGTTVIFVEYPNGGGGTFLGEPIDDDQSSEIGVGYEYGWSPNSNIGTWSDNAGGFGVSLPPGLYESDYDMCAFEGCPLNGEWTLSIIDNLASDDGTIFEFGVNFDPSLFPDVTTFTPIYGSGSDSSYWQGPYITSSSPDGNTITVLPDVAGIFDYTFYTSNNFGCAFDTTVTVNVTATPQVFTGEDIMVCEGEEVFLNSTLDEENPPLCSQDGGSYTYCYTNNDNTVFTFCPDNQGDGISFMGITFTAGTVENIIFDAVTFYDGPDTSSPIIDAVAGDLAGLVFVASNASGCITMQITSDGSVSCESGSYPSMEFNVGCEFALLNYDFSWTPAQDLSQSDIPGPQVLNPAPGEYSYNVSMYPPGFPECATTAEATVIISEIPNAGIDSEDSFCANSGEFALFSLLDGNPDAGGEWFDQNDDPISENFDPAVDEPGTFVYRLDNNGCTAESELTVEVNNLSLEAISDTTVCINGTASFTAVPQGNINQPIDYFWSGTAGNANGQDYSFSPTSNPSLVEVYATYGDNCETDVQNALVNVRAPLSMNIMNGDIICPEADIDIETFNVQGGLAPYEYQWIGEDGTNLNGNPVNVSPDIDTEYCVTVNDACETTPITDCVTIQTEPVLDASFMADITDGCSPINVSFLGVIEQDELVSTVTWDFGDGVVSNDLNFANHTYLDPGSFDVTLTVTSVQGCVFDSTYTDLITPWPNPDAEFSASPQTVYLPETSFEFINNSFGGGFSEWTFGYYGTSYETNPDFEFPVEDAQIIEVELVSTNLFGCTDTIRKNVFIQEQFVLFVPNAFTPDGDGINDFFFVNGKDVDENDYSIKIFDRWGEKVWESKNINIPWDGSYNNGGYYLKEGVYVWHIETRSVSTADKKEVMGHITLLR